jgi:hypothetical protein
MACLCFPTDMYPLLGAFLFRSAEAIRGIVRLMGASTEKQVGRVLLIGRCVEHVAVGRSRHGAVVYYRALNEDVRTNSVAARRIRFGAVSLGVRRAVVDGTCVGRRAFDVKWSRRLRCRRVFLRVLRYVQVSSALSSLGSVLGKSVLGC